MNVNRGNSLADVPPSLVKDDVGGFDRIFVAIVMLLLEDTIRGARLGRKWESASAVEGNRRMLGFVYDTD